MSNKPIHAEIVRADQIRVGDRILRSGKIILIAIVERDLGDDTHAFKTYKWPDETWRGKPSDFVARILPEPVEVRELWRAECHGMTYEGDKQQCREWIRMLGYVSTLEEITEIVKIREEVQS